MLNVKGELLLTPASLVSDVDELPDASVPREVEMLRVLELPSLFHPAA